MTEENKTEEVKAEEVKAPEEDKKPKTIVEKVKKVLKIKDSLEDLVQEWRKCRNPRKRGELLRKIRAKRK